MNKKVIPYFHVSKLDLGEKPLFIPKIPDSSLIDVEGDIPRICVSETIYGCLLAISGVGRRKLEVSDILLEFRESIKGFETLDEWLKRSGVYINPTVYQTTETPFLPPKASDFRFTKERWFLKPIELTRVGYLSISSLIEGKIQIVNRSGVFKESSSRILSSTIVQRKIYF